MIYLFDYYKALLRVTTRQPQNYHLPVLSQDICKYIFSFIESENASTVIEQNMYTSIKSKIRRYCKLISEDQSVYQKYVKSVKNNSDNEKEFYSTAYGYPKQIISIVSDINTQAYGVEDVYFLTSGQFKDYVKRIVNTVFEEEKNVWKYKWYDKEKSIKYHKNKIENYILENSDDEDDVEEMIGPLQHCDTVLKSIELRCITWITEDLIDMEHSINFNYIDYTEI